MTPWHWREVLDFSPPTITFSADDVGSLAALEAYRMYLLSRHQDAVAAEVYSVRQRFFLWQQTHVDKVRRPTVESVRNSCTPNIT